MRVRETHQKESHKKTTKNQKPKKEKKERKKRICNDEYKEKLLLTHRLVKERRVNHKPDDWGLLVEK